MTAPTREQIEAARAYCAGYANHTASSTLRESITTLLAATAELSEEEWLIAHVDGEDAGYSLSSTETDARELFDGICCEADVDDVFLCRVVARREGRP